MAVVLNHDVAGIYNRLNRFIVELQFSASSSVSRMSGFDQARLSTYLAAIDAYHEWVKSQPLLDLPETTPREIELSLAPGILTTENEEVNDVVRLLVLGRDELTSSQSARQGSGLVGFDSIRLTAVVEKVRAFLSSYIEMITPLDQPESSPSRPVTGPGSDGI